MTFIPMYHVFTVYPKLSSVFSTIKPDCYIRAVEKLPISERIEQVLVMAPAELLAYKVMAYYRHRGKPKAGTDWRDIAMLLLTFPQFQENPTAMTERLVVANAIPEMIELWRQLARQKIEPVDEDEDF